jgi:hypothetical protein
MLYLAKPQILLLILGALSLIQMVSLSRVNMKEIIVEPQFPLLAMLMAMVLMI